MRLARGLAAVLFIGAASHMAAAAEPAPLPQEKTDRAAETGDTRRTAETAANSDTVSARKERSRVIFLI